MYFLNILDNSNFILIDIREVIGEYFFLREIKCDNLIETL